MKQLELPIESKAPANVIRVYVMIKDFVKGGGATKKQYGAWHTIAGETDRFYVSGCGVTIMKVQYSGYAPTIETSTVDQIGDHDLCNVCKRLLEQDSKQK